MEVFQAALVALLLLLIGDFLSTFLYHVPEHIFGKFHSLVHHGKNRSFIHYHQNAKVAYGDIFTFYDRPARAWYRVLLLLKRKFKKNAIAL
jgi:hypothetical protein